MAKKKKVSRKKAVFHKGKKKSSRNLDDPAYIKWRTEVYKRDNYKCRWCGENYLINAHHIKKWAKYPSLRFIVSNGITLCHKCHKKVKDKEDAYIGFFARLLVQALVEKIKDGI